MHSLPKDEHLSYGADVGELVCEITGADHPLEQPDEYAVYVLECEGYDPEGYQTEEKFKDDWRFWATTDEFDGYPYEPEKWAWAAYYSDRLFYVGQTESLFYRLLDHQAEPEKTSIFNVVFQPMRIEKIEWMSTREQAKKREKELAQHYSDRSKDWFSYSA